MAELLIVALVIYVVGAGLTFMWGFIGWGLNYGVDREDARAALLIAFSCFIWPALLRRAINDTLREEG